MAYIAANLSLIGQTIGGTLRRWAYPSLDDQATIAAAGYFDDPRLQGGDWIYVTLVDSIEPPRTASDAFVLVVNGT